MNISILGLGYVGSVSAACLASRGHKVVGVDVNRDKVETINNGNSPIIEPGLQGLISEGVKTGNLKATVNTSDAVAHGKVLLVCVGTPSDEKGNLNFHYVDRVCVEIASALRSVKEYKLIVIRSTLLPGTLNDRLIPLLEQESDKKVGAEFGVAVNPEFMRESSAIADFENPPFTLIGQMDERGGDILEELYVSIPAPVFRTDPDTACMVKYASNAFHGLKVVFANEIGQLCKRMGVDGIEVMDIFCQDKLLNISSRYLRPGFAFGGSCLPKDLRALLYLARHRDIELPVLEAILPSNRLQVQRAIDLVLRDQRKNVGVIGLTFKPGTDDLRESPMVELVEVLSGKGLQVRIYDDNMSLSRLVGGNKEFIERTIPHIAGLMCPTMGEVVNSSDILVVAHDCGNGREQLIDMVTPDHLVIDLVKVNPLHKQQIFAYEGIGW